MLMLPSPLCATYLTLMTTVRNLAYVMRHDLLPLTSTSSTYKVATVTLNPEMMGILGSR